MKALVLALVLTLFGSTSISAMSTLAMDKGKKEDKGKKNPPGPPVVTDKQPRDKQPPPPKKGKGYSDF